MMWEWARHFLCNELEALAYFIYALVLLLQYRYAHSARHRVLFLFYAAAALLLLAGLTITVVLNNWSYNILFLVNICVFSWYFKSLLYSKQKKAIVTVCCVVNILVLLYFDSSGNSFFVFNGYAYGISFITIVLYTLFYFHQLMDHVQEENILLSFDFWLVCGYLMYFLGTFFIVIYYEHVAVNKRANVWAIQNSILFICSLIMLSAHLSISRKQKLLHG